MILKKTNEKILIWMHREGISQKEIADKVGVTRQTWAKKMNENTFTPGDMIALKRMGFKG